ncbi:hypothetical protein [Thalassospira xiamenensis]|uniref:Uncharacterized protein n=1 Tax=Thalassospira xiamenensis TaxID=220697 RepID=A0A285TY07_9PROT|nr:hypothetical protein [Thalassospira xiamenensis]SOC30387.1 hypothetical protein SAMN05428964_10926 [Thalassospira xiamenensis]
MLDDAWIVGAILSKQIRDIADDRDEWAAHSSRIAKNRDSWKEHAKSVELSRDEWKAYAQQLEQDRDGLVEFGNNLLANITQLQAHVAGLKHVVKSLQKIHPDSVVFSASDEISNEGKHFAVAELLYLKAYNQVLEKLGHAGKT